MVSVLFIAATFVIAIIVLTMILRARMGSIADLERFPFERTAPLSPPEQVLYWRLRKIMPEQIVLAQVALSRIVRVQKGHDFRRWLNRINRMTVDFLVCLADGTIVAAIELDDASHDVDDRMFADAKKSKALESAGIKLLRFRELPSERELRRTFLE